MVLLSTSRAVVGNQALRSPVEKATVQIHSDAGEIETLVGKANGTYLTNQIPGRDWQKAIGSR